MITYKSKTQPEFSFIISAYIKRYGGWILLIWLIFLLMLRSQNFPIILFPIVLLSIFIGYGRSYPKNRIIYKVIINHSNKQIILYSYILWKHKTVIPFEKLYFDYFIKVNKKMKPDEWLIVFGKRPWIVIGTIKSTGGTDWDYDKMKELAFELYQIKKRQILWKPQMPFLIKSLAPGYKELKFDFEEE